MTNTALNHEFEPAQDTSPLAASESLSVLVLGPDDRRRAAVAFAAEGPFCSEPRQLPFYPEVAQTSKVVEMAHDVVAVDLDSNPAYALEVIESLCAASPALTVMVYSAVTDSDLMIRCMRAGAREFLSLPVNGSIMAEALNRAVQRRTSMRPLKKADGRLCMFWGAKGGSGVTTIATNFAIAAAHESGKRVLLIDLDLPLGDAVLNLGLTPQYSTVDALQNHVRLDANYLNRIVSRHDSGLWVLAAPGKLMPVPFSVEAVDKLLNVARQEFDCVVVDSGSRFELTGTSLFEPQSHIYLISQLSISDLRNCNRLASDFFVAKAPNFEVVLNRYDSSSLALDDEHVTRIITKKPQWKIPNDYNAVCEMQTNASPLPHGESGIALVIEQMVRTVLGLPERQPAKKKKHLMNLF